MKYNRFLRERLTKAPLSKSADATVDPSADLYDRNDKTDFRLGKRKKIGLVDDEPKAIVHTPEGLTPRQQALREAVVNRFMAKKAEKYISEQIEHINSKQQLAKKLRFLFDEAGRPPANAPIEDIVAVRKKIEAEIRFLEAICSAMRSHLTKVKEAEEMAFELINGHNDE